MITGLGGQFDSRSRLHAVFSKIVGLLYKVSLSKYQNVIFQNSDDVATLLEKRILKPSQMHVVNGSGVGLDEYPQAPLPSEPIVFLSIARYLVAKGIREYAQAAREIKKTNPNIIFRLVGFEETGKTAIPIAEIRQLHDEGIIEAVGKVDNAYNQLEQCHIYVLASFYGEGLPRTILEAMAVGRPILTTNNVGCREAVVEGVNGKLVEPKSAETLASGMRWFLDNPQQWQAMASASREMAENKYDVRIVNAEMRRIMDL